jgi:transposase
MKVCTACAVRADRVFGCDKRYVHFDTTSIAVYGDYRPAEETGESEVPLRIPYGSSKDKRPDLKQCVLATLGVDRAVPLWGQPEDGHASDKTVHNTVLSNRATFLATHGGAPGASIYGADAALVTEDNRAARGDTLFITRLPATSSECGRLIAEAVAHNTWEEVGVLAHTQPTKHRAVTAYKVSEGEGTLYGTAYRAVVVHSSPQDKRRQQRLARDRQASESAARPVARQAAQQEYCCCADAETAAATLRARPTAYHLLAVVVEDYPLYGRGRPRARPPRPLNALRYRLKITIHPDTERLRRREDEAGCCGLRTNVPMAGDLAHSARDLLTVYKAQHGTEQNYGFLKAPVMVNSLFLKKPERIEALGLVFLLALLIGRLMERARRRHVDTPSTPLPGWDKNVTERPTAFMMVTQFVGGIVLKLGHDRQRARPLSVVPQHSLSALDVPAPCCTLPAGSQRTPMAAWRLARRQKQILQWLAVDHPRTRGMIRRSHQDLVRALPGDKSNLSHSLQPLEARGLMGIGRSPGGKAESLWLTPEGQTWASHLAGRCDEGENDGAAMGCNA